MAPVELIGLARLERQRDEGGNTIAGILASVGLPARRVSAHSIVGALKTFAHQQVMDPRHPQPLAPAAHLVLFQQRIEPSLERPDPRQRLNRSEERRVGKGWVSTVRSRWSPDT